MATTKPITFHPGERIVGIARLLSTFRTLRLLAGEARANERFLAVASAESLEYTAHFGDRDLVHVIIRPMRRGDESSEAVNGFSVRMAWSSVMPVEPSIASMFGGAVQQALAFIDAAREILNGLPENYHALADEIGEIASGPRKHWSTELDLPAALAGLDGPLDTATLLVPHGGAR